MTSLVLVLYLLIVCAIGVFILCAASEPDEKKEDAPPAGDRNVYPY